MQERVSAAIDRLRGAWFDRYAKEADLLSELWQAAKEDKARIVAFEENYKQALAAKQEMAKRFDEMASSLEESRSRLDGYQRDVATFVARNQELEKELAKKPMTVSNGLLRVVSAERDALKQEAAKLMAKLSNMEAQLWEAQLGGKAMPPFDPNQTAFANRNEKAKWIYLARENGLQTNDIAVRLKMVPRQVAYDYYLGAALLSGVPLSVRNEPRKVTRVDAKKFSVEEQRRYAVAQYRAGVKQKFIARALGVSQAQVSRLVHRGERA